jgi:hypothetical protein
MPGNQWNAVPRYDLDVAVVVVGQLRQPLIRRMLTRAVVRVSRPIIVPINFGVEAQTARGIERVEQLINRFSGQHTCINVPIPDCITTRVMGHPALGEIRRGSICRFDQVKFLEAFCRHREFPKGSVPNELQDQCPSGPSSVLHLQ